MCGYLVRVGVSRPVPASPAVFQQPKAQHGPCGREQRSRAVFPPLQKIAQQIGHGHGRGHAPPAEAVATYSTGVLPAYRPMQGLPSSVMQSLRRPAAYPACAGIAFAHKGGQRVPATADALRLDQRTAHARLPEPVCAQQPAADDEHVLCRSPSSTGKDGSRVPSIQRASIAITSRAGCAAFSESMRGKTPSRRSNGAAAGGRPFFWDCWSGGRQPV